MANRRSNISREGVYTAAETYSLLKRYYSKGEIEKIIDKSKSEVDEELEKFYDKATIDALLEDKSDIDHDHDERYYTHAEVITLISQATGVVALDDVDVQKTSGASSLDYVKAWQSGHVVFVRLVLKSGNSSVAAGSNTFVGTITGAPLPPENAIGSSYLSSTGFICNLSTDGTITVRVIGAAKAASTTAVIGITWTYITLTDPPGGGGSGEIYDGAYTVIPDAFDPQTLATRNKQMIDDVTVTQIPTYETSNLSGGTTFYIATAEDE